LEKYILINLKVLRLLVSKVNQALEKNILSLENASLEENGRLY